MGFPSRRHRSCCPLRQLRGPCTRRELADFSGLSRPSLALALQRLTSKGPAGGEPPVIWMHEARPDPEAGSVIADLEASQEDALADRLAGFTPEERKEYLAFSQRITENPPALLAELSPVATFWGQKDSFRIFVAESPFPAYGPASAIGVLRSRKFLFAYSNRTTRSLYTSNESCQAIRDG